MNTKTLSENGDDVLDKLLELHGLNKVPDKDLKFAVVFARYKNQWIISRQQQKDTWEVQGGHRDPGEDIEYTAARELYEESGAEQFVLMPITDYSMARNGSEGIGRLFYAEVNKLNELPMGYEIEEVQCVETFPPNMTYAHLHDPLYKIITNNGRDSHEEGYTFEVHSGRIHQR